MTLNDISVHRSAGRINYSGKVETTSRNFISDDQIDSEVVMSFAAAFWVVTQPFFSVVVRCVTTGVN